MGRLMNMQLQLFEDASTRHNVFFAVQPTAAAGARSVGLAAELVGCRRIGARLLPLERLHVSLFTVGGFVDPRPSIIIDEAKTVAGTVLMTPFELYSIVLQALAAERWCSRAVQEPQAP